MREGGRRLIRRQVGARRGRGAKGDGEPRAGGSASNEERQELTEKKKKKKGKKEKGRTLQFIDRPTVGPSGDARGKIKNAARLAERGRGVCCCCCQWHRWRWRTSRRALRKISAQKVRTSPAAPRPRRVPEERERARSADGN